MAATATKKRMTGSCACGAVTFTAAANPLHLDCCYCKQCQQISGAPVVAWMGISKAKLYWSGTITTLRLSDLAQRGFCAACGGTLYMNYDCYPAKTHVAAALITSVEPDALKVGCHIFVGSKPSWFKIGDDDAPRYENWDPEFVRLFPDVIERWKANQAAGAK